MTIQQRCASALRDAYRFPGFTPARAIRQAVADPDAVVVTLHRRQKNGLRRLWHGLSDVV